jgi:hypothetical protein
MFCCPAGAGLGRARTHHHAGVAADVGDVGTAVPVEGAGNGAHIDIGRQRDVAEIDIEQRLAPLGCM